MSEALLALSTVELRRRIGTKEISPIDLLEASVARIQALNPAVNAITATDYRTARDTAMAAEKAALRGEPLGRLHGRRRQHASQQQDATPPAQSIY